METMTVSEFFEEYGVMESHGSYFAFPGLDVSEGTTRDGETVINSRTPDVAIFAMAEMIERDAKFEGVELEEDVDEYLF